MLISFSVENWMSYREEASLSLIPSRIQKHRDRLPRLSKYDLSVLPTAVIYGGNASGKTNFFQALRFARELIVEGTKRDQMIKTNPFKLIAKNRTKPCSFHFQILVEDAIYEYSFSVTSTIIHSERLLRLLKTTEHLLFERKSDIITLQGKFKNDKRLHQIKAGTRDNQLFLTNAIDQKYEALSPISNWFRDTLTLIAPDARFANFNQYYTEENPLCESMNELLSQLDTGIKRLGTELIPFEQTPFPDEIKKQLLAEITGNTEANVMTEDGNNRFIVSREKDELIVKKLYTFHEDNKGNEIKFELQSESDGSKRVLDLLPIFHRSKGKGTKRVYIVDELDRSLHPSLTKMLIQSFLDGSNKDSRSQIIFTTHDVMLMDQDLFRQDEVWITERDRAGRSTLYALNDFEEIRYDKDIRKSYLQGRLGGLPKILKSNFYNYETGV